MTEPRIASTPISTFIRGSAAVGCLGLAFSLWGSFHQTRLFFQSYLFSYLFWVDLPLGALPLLMIYPLTGGRWGAASRKILEALSDTILLLALFSLPILFGLKWIYPWLDPAVAADPRILHKHLYLNPASFIVRTLFYFACWVALRLLLKRNEEASRTDSRPEARAKLRTICAAGLVLYGFSVTFASVDWQMSVEPTWYSTIYGMLYAIGQTLSALAFALIVFGIATAKRKYRELFPKETFRDLGNVFLALVMIWAYLSFMQYLIVWSGNLPHEVIWFTHRSQGGWQWLISALALFQFTAPFLLLLFRGSKDHPGRLAWIGGLVFTARIIDHYWMVMPGLLGQCLVLPWETITTWLGIGGIWLAVFLTRLARKPLFAEQDPDWPKPYLVIPNTIFAHNGKAPSRG